MYQVVKDNVNQGAPFSDEAQAINYARSIGGCVKPVEDTQNTVPCQEELTQ